MTVVVRSAADAANLGSELRRLSAGIDPDQPVRDIQTYDQLIAGAASSPRSVALVFGLLAGMATVLAVIGMYGVMTHYVTPRTRELGLRMALGAARRDVLGLVIVQGMRPVVAGIVLGVAAALALTRLLRGLLYGIGATDAATFGGVVVILLVAGLVACYLPARRAAGIDSTRRLHSGTNDAPSGHSARLHDQHCHRWPGLARRPKGRYSRSKSSSSRGVTTETGARRPRGARVSVGTARTVSTRECRTKNSEC
jgi:hypothetical protein